MGNVEEYRRKAQQAEHDATLLSRADERQAMLDIAKAWLALAAEEEARQAQRD